MQKANSRTAKNSIAVASLFASFCFSNHAADGRAADQDPPSRGKSVPAYVSAQHDKAKVRTVHVVKANVRSGPSDKYYATSVLPKGASVEVYLETSDGWSGIRPPANSHDWIPANIAYLLPGGKTAEVIEDQTPSWIGSDSKEVNEFMWQTALAKSQQVQILGEESQLSADGTKQVWYKISPPQGEFRWIKTSQLSDTQPVEESAPTKHQVSPNFADAKRQGKSPTGVQLASHTEPIEQSLESSDIVEENADGKIVWSNEQEVLAQIQRQIRSEQAEAQGSIGGEAEGELVAEEPMSPSPKPIQKPSNKIFSIRPIPMGNSPKKAKAMEHQTDAMRQWDAMQAGGQTKHKVGPVGTVLGLIGIGVIEAERAPVNATIAKQYHNRNTNNLGQIGPIGAGRLDRLPRPGQRGPSMTLPLDAPLENYPTDLPYQEADAYSQSSSTPPYSGRENTFSKWLQSREPLFGGNPTGNPNGYPQPMANGIPPRNLPLATQPPMMQVYPNATAQDTTAWHGLKSTMHPTPSDNSSDEIEEFQTPEVQAALVQLGQEVAGPTADWDLTNLRGKASQWIEGGATAMVRGEARLLMERIDRFESLRQRTLGLMQNNSMIAQNIPNYAGGTLAPSNAVIPASAIGTGVNANNAVSNGVATVTGQAGDASGWLVQVHTSFPGQPEFALTDDVGNVITYVQSTGGLNLRRYLQQPVTVYGLRGYVPNLAAKQIVAERVVRMK